MDVKKYIDFSREYIKKAVKFSQNKTVDLLKYSKSIIKKCYFYSLITYRVM